MDNDVHESVHPNLRLIEITNKMQPCSTGCPTSYRTRHFFNNSNTNEDNATKFEQQYVRCVRNEEECVYRVWQFLCNIFIGVRIIKEMPSTVASGTPCRIYYSIVS
jgi:hypothetical protein